MGLLDKLSGRVSGLLDDVLLSDEQRTALKRAQKALRDDDPREALRLLDPLDERKPGLARVAEWRGEAWLALGQHGEAMAALRRAAELRAGARALRLLAQALELSHDAKGARDVLREALQHDPAPDERLAILERLGALHASLGRPDKAARELRKALRLARATPGLQDAQPDLAVALADALLARGAGQGALDEGRAALQDAFGPSLWAACEAAERALEAQDERALADAARSLRRRAWEVLGRLLLAQGEAARALACAESARALGEAHEVGLWLTSARAALAAGHAAKALELGRSTIERAQGSALAEARVLASRAALLQGSPASALAYADAALQTQADHLEALEASARASLALARAAEGEPRRRLAAEAEEKFLRLRVARAEDAEALRDIGVCRGLKGDWHGARRILWAALEAREDVETRVELAWACVEAGEHAEGVALYSELVGRGVERAREGLEEAHRRHAAPLALPAAGCRSLVELTRGLRELQARVAAQPRWMSFLPALHRALEALEAPLDVAVVGEFNAGKSTLVNALLGEAVVATGVLPTTAHIHILRFGARRVAWLHRKDGGVEEVAFSQVKAAAKRDEGARTLSHIEYLYPHPDLRRVHLWDTPGFNALDPDHERYAREALARAQAIVWILDAEQALKGTELALLEQVAHSAQRLLVALNKVDRLGETDEAREAGLAALMGHLRPALEGRCVGIFALSGLEGLRAKLAQDAQGLARSGLAAFEAALEEHLYDKAALLKAVEADRALGEVAEQLAAQAQAQAEALRAREQGVEQLRAGIEAERAGFVGEVLPQERARLDDALEVLRAVAARELDEALHPSAGLVDALLTRMELDGEDVDFVSGLLQERAEQLLGRSAQRVQAALGEREQRIADAAEALFAGLDARDARALRRRLKAWMDQARLLRGGLDERCYAPQRAALRARLGSADAAQTLRKAAKLAPSEAQALLRPLLGALDAGAVAALEAWSGEYFAWSARLCDALRGDLQVFALEANPHWTRALRRATLPEVAPQEAP